MGHNNMCSDYNGLIGPDVVVVATEFYKFWLKVVYTARPYWLQLGYRHLKLTSLCIKLPLSFQLHCMG